MGRMSHTCRIRRLSLLIGTLALCITITWLLGNALNHAEYVDHLRVMHQATTNKTDQHNNRRFQRSEVNSTVKKILLFAYMRGGSSLAGEMFNRNPDAMLWYEPLDHFYAALFGTHIYSVPGTLAFWNNGTRRTMSPTEKHKLTAFIGDLLSCNYANLPVESLSHIFLDEPLSMARYAQCFSSAVYPAGPWNRTARYVKRTAGYADRAAGYGRPTAGYADRPAGYGNRAAGYGRPTARDGRPTAGYVKRTAGYGRPAAGYERPTAGHGRPAAEYVKRTAGHGRPAAEYVKRTAGYRKRTARSLLSTNSRSHGFGGWSELFYCKAALKPICGLTVEDAIRAKCPEMIDLTRSIWRQGNATMRQVMAAMERAAVKYQLGNITRPYVQSFLDYQLCLERIRERVEMCRPLAERECRKRKVQVLELVRANMADVRDVLEALPDVRVIYYMRDPRAVALSRVATNLMRAQSRENTSDAATEEAEYLCRKMALDIDAKQALEAEDPGSVFTMTYEELVRDPLAAAERVYGFVGSQLPANTWSAFVRTHMYGGRSDGKFGISRKNASRTVSQWKEKMSYASIEPLTAVCRHVLSQLNYTHCLP